MPREAIPLECAQVSLTHIWKKNLTLKLIPQFLKHVHKRKLTVQNVRKVKQKRTQKRSLRQDLRANLENVRRN